jgi:hypothetical protein
MRQDERMKIKNIKLGITGGNKGFTLLLASLIASIVLALGTSIYTLASKEVTLSATGRDSQFAFYAADTGAECALYWDARTDIHPNTFATSSGASHAPSLTCDGANPPPAITIQSSTASAATSTFEINLFSNVTGGPYCADVTVSKWLDQSTNSERTVIQANGYSVGCTTIQTAPTALQRSVELVY